MVKLALIDKTCAAAASERLNKNLGLGQEMVFGSENLIVIVKKSGLNSYAC